ncbi:MAG: 50S ribosomal protein L10 [Candidatus Omnitrophica bacterium]|nr:50S ribosomal protein L10 [Candidatus Omnitrophota bacterium]
MAQKYGRKVREMMVKETKAVFTENNGFVLSSIENVKAAEIDVLRKKIKQSGSRYMVIKNSLASIALKDSGIEGLTEAVKEKKILGVGVVKDDPVKIAKILSEFAKKNKGFNITAGRIEGSVVGAERIKELSDLPSREQLISMVLSMMNAPVTGFVGVLSGLLRKVLYAVKAIKEKKENG